MDRRNAAADRGALCPTNLSIAAADLWRHIGWPETQASSCLLAESWQQCSTARRSARKETQTGPTSHSADRPQATHFCGNDHAADYCTHEPAPADEHAASCDRDN